MFFLAVWILFFFFNDTATTEIYTLSLHDALPISVRRAPSSRGSHRPGRCAPKGDRKSTRLNSSHGYISYAVFCLKKKMKPPSPYRVAKKEKTGFVAKRVQNTP